MILHRSSLHHDEISPDDQVRLYVEDLYERRHSELLKQAYNMVSSWDHAEEIVAEVYTKILTQPHQLLRVAQDKRDNYVSIMVKHFVIDNVYRKRRLQQFSLREDDQDRFSDPQLDPETALQRDHVIAVKTHCINLLNQADKQLLHLLFELNLGYKIIAEKYQTTQVSLRKKMQRIRAALRACYEKEQHE